ncbi:LPS-assembly protein LptD [Thiomicrorhabdus sediminis]|uniref:LPS-assembly protein LptD n=1 Tax=Thiomicrorhabdus sediminis TaxID=2580412 RepID=A0A4P9K427_9GAMM|nr:LPS assembly protein LptD [Thiomicrorhabdus sediminis]QCU89669.1 LPS-assembly protein LptD [Thiomicrorhabdus sediminis]
MSNTEPKNTFSTRVSSYSALKMHVTPSHNAHKPCFALSESLFKKPPFFIHALLVASLGSLTFTNSSWAQSTLDCQPQLISPQPAIPSNADAQGQQQLEADQLSQPSQDQYLMQGQAVIKQPGMVIKTDQALYNKSTEQAKLSGHVEIHQNDLIIKAEKALLDNQKQQAQLDNTEYQILPSRAYGEAKSIQSDQKNEVTSLDQASLTSCPLNTDQSKDWDFKFDSLEINNQSRRVVGRNTVLYFKGVPIFYTPYFDYPLDDRASGLLFPETGSYKSINSTQSEQYFKQPYYFNIAANMDDTLSVMPMSKRGLVVDNEFRFLQQSSNPQNSRQNQQFAGSLQLSAIQDSYDNEDRWRARFDSQQLWGHGFSSSIAWDSVSDKNFYADIPVDKTLNTATLKQRHAQINYRQGNLSTYLQVLNYLELQNSSDNYEKLPEFGLLYSKSWQQTRLDFNATATQFAVSSSNHTKPEALRIHLAPRLTHQLRKPYGKLTTTLVANQTQYQMEDNGNNPTGKETLNRFVPQFALRGNLIFDRDLELFGKNYSQTLEPELQYLYTPYVDQSDISLFDSAERSLDFNNLFALNRFSGYDRIADSNQLSLAINSKLYEVSGEQIAQIGIGQIYYLQDRKVGLNGNSLQTDKVSDYFAHIGVQKQNLSASSTMQLDKDSQSLLSSNSRLKWQNDKHTVLINHSLYNKTQADESEFLSFGGYTRINNRWDLGIYTSYDMKDNRHSASQLGIRYDSCCWALEMIAERTQLENGLYNDGIQFQFELKGLSSSQSKFKQDLTNKLNF